MDAVESLHKREQELQEESFYIRICERIIEKYPDLKYIDLEDICFIIVDRDVKEHIKVQKITGTDVYITNYRYKLIISHSCMIQLHDTQIKALLYRELRRIKRNGDVAEYEIKDNSEMLGTFGAGWCSYGQQLPDILGPDFEGFSNLPGLQVSMFDGPKIVK